MVLLLLILLFLLLNVIANNHRYRNHHTNRCLCNCLSTWHFKMCMQVRDELMKIRIVHNTHWKSTFY